METEVPVDISNVSALFFGIIILTGYIYLARSLYRLPVALYLGGQLSVYELAGFTQWHKNKLDALNSKDSSVRFRWLQKASITFYMYLIVLLFWMLVFPLISLGFGRNASNWQLFRDRQAEIFGFNKSTLSLELCRILDRIGL